MLSRRVADGAVVLAVCAGFQVAGWTFPGADGAPHEGLGLLEIDTVKGEGPRAVGEVLAEVTGVAGLPVLTGFENHGGRTTLADEAVALGRVETGVGNGGGTPARAPFAAASWGRTCTARCWRGTPPWPTCCWAGPSTTCRWHRSTTPAPSNCATSA